MKNNSRLVLLFLTISMLLTACQAAGNLVQTSKPADSTPVATPQDGKASITGRVVSTKDGSPYVNVPVRLAQIFRKGEEGAYVLDLARSPGNFTDEKGNVIIENFDPAEYLIVVGKPEDNNYIIYHGDDGKPVTYQIEANKVLDIGTISVDYTP